MTRTAHRGSHAGCDYWASFKTTALSSSGRRRSPGELCRGDEGLHLFEILATTVRPVGPGLRIDPRRTDRGDRRGDIIGAEPAGEDDRDADLVDDAAAEVPVVDTAERP